MAERNELVARAEAAGLKVKDLPANDSVLEQQVLEAEAAIAPHPLVGGDMLSKKVVQGDGTKVWVTAGTKDDLAEAVEAKTTEEVPEFIDINEAQ